MTTDKRPRIPADLAERLDRARGDIPFERYVRMQLTEAVGGVIRAEKNPDAQGWRVVGENGDVLVNGITKRNAEFYARVLSLAGRAYNVAWELVAELADEPDFLDSASSAADTLHKLGDDLAARLGVDLETGIPENRSPSTGRRVHGGRR
jgi:hypothetical protein